MAIPYDLSNDGDGPYITVPTHVPFGRIVRVIKRIPGCKAMSSHSLLSIITDDCSGKFELDGHRFDIDTMMSDYYVIQAASGAVPRDVIDKICKALDAHQSLLGRLLGLGKRSGA